MAKQERKAIEGLKNAIRNKRVELGLPPEGTLNTRQLLESLQKDPPIETIVRYVRSSLGQSGYQPARLQKKEERPIPRFDKKA
jgi:hypothetical protein